MAMHDNARVPGLRVGDAERDAAAADLGDHYAAGRLTLDEFHERLSQVLAARTQGELSEVLADLPPVRHPEPPPVPVPPQRSQDWDEHIPSSAGRLAAVALLLIAILIWLFTVAMFTRHGGYYNPPYPYYPHHPLPWGP